MGACGETSASRTTFVLKLKKDVDVALSPVGIESAHLLIEVTRICNSHLLQFVIYFF